MKKKLLSLVMAAAMVLGLGCLRQQLRYCGYQRQR